MRAVISSKMLMVLLSWFLSCAVVCAWDDASYQKGISAAKSVQSQVGTPDQVNSRFSQPLTSQGSSMSTFDGSRSFTAQLPTGQSTDMFLDLVALASATGDITTLTFKEDTDLNGEIDHTYTAPVPISGVCKNGFISATPGTWGNLEYYIWNADNSGRATATQTPYMTSLAGCYCINSSCGSNLVWNNFNLVLQDLGNGIVSAVQAQKNLMITNVDTSSLAELKYYAQNSGSMGNQTGFIPSGVSDPRQYYNGGSGTLPGNAELANESANPDSFYSRLNNLNNAMGNQMSSQQCNIKRQASFTVQSQMIGYDVDFYIGYDANGGSKDCFWAKSDGSCQNDWARGIGWPAGCTNENLLHLDDIISAIVFPTGQCVPYTDPHSGGTGCIAPPANLSIATYQFLAQTASGRSPGCYGSGDDNTHQYWHIQAFTVSNPGDYHFQYQGNLIFGVNDIPQSTTTGSCAGLENNSGCILIQETVCDYNNSNCVYIYNNYNPTGLTPLTSCQQLTSPDTGVTWTFCADGSKLTYQQGATAGTLESGTDIWWNTNKTYSCQASNVYDFSTAKQRLAKISTSLETNGTAATYNDIGSSGNSISLPPPQNTSSCEISCQVKVPIENTQAGLSGTTADYQQSINGYQTEIRLCQSNVCPVNTGAGEMLLQDCGCINYFNQAAATMQLLDEASRDVICSGSPP